MKRLVDVVPAVENRIEQLRELVDGFELGQIFLTSLEFDIFTELQRPKGADDLASRLGLHAGLTEKLLDVLVGMGLLTRDAQMYRTALPVAPFLVKDSPYFGRYLNPRPRIRESMANLAAHLRNGPGEFSEAERHTFKRDDLDWMARLSLLGRLQGTVTQVSALPEFRQARRMIDLGGGHGLFALAFAQENPNLEVVVFDKPDVVEVARTTIDQYDLAGRVTARSGDYLKDDFGKDYDIVFEACSFGGDDLDSRSFFQKIASALVAGGLLIRLTFTLDDDKTRPLLPLLWAFKNHLIGNGHHETRTNAAVAQLLDGAGLKLEEIIDMSPWCMNPMRLIISRKTVVNE